jgi:hypothetical protein
VSTYETNQRKVTNIWKENHPKDLLAYCWPKRSEKKENKQRINTLLKQRNTVRYKKAQRLACLGHLERMHYERITKKITRWKSLPHPDLKDNLRRPSNHEDQELEDTCMKGGAMEENCLASQDSFWVVELLQKINFCNNSCQTPQIHQIPNTPLCTTEFHWSRIWCRYMFRLTEPSSDMLTVSPEDGSMCQNM